MKMTDNKHLIYKEDIMDKLIAYAERKHEAGHNEIANGILKAVNYISNNAVSVDAVKVEHGQWIEHFHLEVGGECSVCGWQFQWFENNEARYCPHCGAKMDR